MGVDVWLYAEGDITDAAIEAAETYMQERFGSCRWSDDGARLVRDEEYPERVEFMSEDRYYGPGYERGPWPVIYGYIRAMQAAFPDCTIHYGGDSDDVAPVVTDEGLAEIWTHFLGPDGDDYHRTMSAWAKGLT